MKLPMGKDRLSKRNGSLDLLPLNQHRYKTGVFDPYQNDQQPLTSILFQKIKQKTDRKSSMPAIDIANTGKKSLLVTQRFKSTDKDPINQIDTLAASEID